MLTIVATMQAQQGKEDALSEVVSSLAAAARQEPGNRRYDVFRSTSDPATLLIYEEYEDKAAIDAHASSTHFKEASAKMAQLLAGRPSIRTYKEL